MQAKVHLQPIGRCGVERGEVRTSLMERPPLLTVGRSGGVGRRDGANESEILVRVPHVLRALAEGRGRRSRVWDRREPDEFGKEAVDGDGDVAGEGGRGGRVEKKLPLLLQETHLPFSVGAPAM